MADTGAAAALMHLRNLFAVQRLNQFSDHHLVRRFVDEGDAAAFEVLVRRHGPMVMRVCRQIVRHAQDAEDVFQATFLVLARKAAAIRKQASVASWLHGVAYRLSAQARARTIRQRASEGQREPALRMDLPPDITWQEIQNGLHDELSRLAEAFRAPLVLCYLESKTQDEAARQLGWSVDTLRRRLERGRNILHARLTRRGLTLPAALLAAGLSESAIHPAIAGELVTSTVQAASAFRTGTTIGGVVGATAVALAEKGLKLMFLAKLKTAVALVVSLSVVVGGAGFLARNTLTASHPGEGQVNAEPPPVPVASKPKSDKEPRTDSHGDPLPHDALARLGTLRFRIGDKYPMAFALSPQGKTFAVVVGNWVLQLWDVATGQEIRRFGRVGQGRSIVFAPDGNTLFTTDPAGKGAFLLWDVNTGQQLRKYESPGGGFGKVAVSPDGKMVAGSSQAHGISIWDTDSGRLLKVLNSGDGQPNKISLGPVRFSPDGTTLASGGTKGIVYLWDVAAGKEIRRLVVASPQPVAVTAVTFAGDAVTALAFAPDGKTLASGISMEPTRVWDVNTGKEIRSLSGDPWGASSVEFSPDGNLLACGEGLGKVRVWDPATGKELSHFHAHGRPSTVAFARDGTTLITSGDASVRLWEARTGKELASDRGHTGPIESSFLLPDDRTLVTGSGVNGDGTARQWNVETGKELGRFPRVDPSDQPLAISPDGKTLACRTTTGAGPQMKFNLRLSDLSSGKELALLSRPNMIAASFTPDGKTLFTYSYDVQEKNSSFCTWDVATGKEMRVVARRDGHVMNFALAPNAKTFSYTFNSPPERGELGICIHDAATGATLHQIPLSSFAGDLAYSPDGNILAIALSGLRSGGRETEGPLLRLWNIAAGKYIRFPRDNAVDVDPLREFPGGYYRIAFSPDGKMLSTAGIEGVRLWEVATGGQRLQFSGHKGKVTNFLFADRARKLVSTSDDSTALVWDATGLRMGDGEKTAGDTQALWNALADADAAKAYAAIWTMANTPGRSLAFLTGRLKPVESPDEKLIAKLVLDLDSPTFKVREEASEALAKLADVAEAGLRKKLAGQPSPELRRRVEQILEQLETPSSAQMQIHRAVEVLERIGTPEAELLLQKLAAGAAGARQTREAAASLWRLSKGEAGKHETEKKDRRQKEKER